MNKTAPRAMRGGPDEAEEKTMSLQEIQRRLDDLIRRTEGRVVRASELKPSAKPRPFLPCADPEKDRAIRREKPLCSVRSPRSDDENEEIEIDLGIGDDFAPGTDTRCLKEFYPEAEPLGSLDAECFAWRLRTGIALDGLPSSSGVRMPSKDGVLEHLDLSLGKVLDRQALFGQMRREDLAYLDIESTGLSGGVGVYAFLVALGFFENGRFVVEQYFMEDFPGEPVMLDALAKRLREFKGLVTYNGKTFDLPFLTVRGAMARVVMPFASMPHLDLLHAARRIWRGRLDSCGLSTIEREILGIERPSDVPGSLIPRIYMEYIRGIRRRQIVPVIDHNVQDVATMPALFALFCRYYRKPDHEDLQHQASQAGLAGWFRRAGRAKDAIECLERAALLSRSPIDEHSYSMRLASEYHREGRLEDAADIWRARAHVAPGLLAIDPCIELAKHCEHRTKDFAQAIEWTRLALERLGASAEDDRSIPSEPDSESGLADRIRHRLRRLETRLARQRTGESS